MTVQAQDYLVRKKIKDGRMVTIRSIHADDKAILQEGMDHLSKQSLYFRFFTVKTALTARELAYFTEIDFVHHVGLLASLTVGGIERPVGIGRYIVAGELPKPQAAELAFAVDDEFQGIGIGSMLMKHLLKLARAGGIKQFIAYVLPENGAMLAVFRHSKLPMECKRNEVGVFEITLSLETNEE
jgi:GNAT superfamily N-acetyltransferase